VDVFGEKLSAATLKQNDKESQVQQAEAEFNRLNRRVQELEEDLENTQTKCHLGVGKLDKAAETADNSDRMAKVLQNRAADDEKKMLNLAEQLKEAQKMAEEADKKYDDASKKMSQCETQLEVSDERASVGEFKIIELEEELKVVANNLKSLEVSEEKANQREEYYKEEIKRMTGKLKQSDTRAEFAERSVQKLQKEVG
jgi:chromosome segregation ATPase